MIRSWQLQEAKNKFSQVVEDAVKDGPQVITKHGIDTAVVLSYQTYREMLAGRDKLSAFFRNSPLAGVEIDLTRDMSLPREEATL